jgi:hypothetical protein
VLHHGGAFVEFNHNAYDGAETELECEPDYWAYFSILSTIKRLGYPMVKSLWYYDPARVDELVRLRNDMGCRRMKFIAEDNGRVHLYVEHIICSPEYGYLNPLIEYPLGHVPPHGAAAAEVVDDVFEEDYVGPEMEAAVEIEEDNVGNGVDEVEEVNVENVGPDVGVVFAEMEENVGPEMRAELDGGDTENVDLGTTERNDIFEGASGVNEGINEGPTGGAFVTDLDGALNGGSNVVNESGSRAELNENGEGEPHGLDAEFRNGLDDLLDGNGSGCESVEKEDSAIDIHFEGHSDEEIGLENNFGNFNIDVGEPTLNQFQEVNVDEDVAVREVVTETEPAAEVVSEQLQSEAGDKGKGKKASGSTSKPKRKRGRPSKKKQVQNDSIFDDEVLLEQVNSEIGESSRGRERGFSEDEEYNTEDLDSGCETDEEEEYGRNKKKKFPTFKLPDNMRDYKWEVGTYFVSKHDFIYAMRTYAVHSGRELKFKKNDKIRVRVACKKTCSWMAFLAKIPEEETWQLRKVGEHNCSRGHKLRIMNAKWLGPKLHNRVKESPNLKLSTIMERSQLKWGIEVGPSKAFRARGIAKDLVDGSFREQYVRIYDYAHELIRSNPHSTVRVSTQPFQGSEEQLEVPGAVLCPHFQRMYICFKACKESFFKCNRPIIGLDGCFLKGYYGGQLLAAIGRDPNDQMMPIAFAVVEGETKESWAWFLDLLVGDLGGVSLCKTYTFISDQQKVNFLSLFIILRS